MYRYRTFAAAALDLAGSHVFTVEDAGEEKPDDMELDARDSSHICDLVLSTENPSARWYVVESGDAHLGYIYVVFNGKGDTVGVWA